MHKYIHLATVKIITSAKLVKCRQMIICLNTTYKGYKENNRKEYFGKWEITIFGFHFFESAVQISSFFKPGHHEIQLAPSIYICYIY